MSRLKKGDVVMVYKDPITKQKPEGLARLHESKPDDIMMGLELWDVEFKSELGQYFPRVIDPKSIKKVDWREI